MALLPMKIGKPSAPILAINDSCPQGRSLGQIRHMLPGIEGERRGRKKEKEPELPIFQGRGGEWRLTTTEKKRILLNNIYGVDIDRQAVEVTKLSLLLKVLEGENEETISKQLTLFSEKGAARSEPEHQMREFVDRLGHPGGQSRLGAGGDREDQSV